MKVRTQLRKRINDAKRAERLLRARIALTNDTGLADDVVLAILKAERGPWTTWNSVDELFAYLGIET